MAFPRGCDTDTIVIALIDFVDVYTSFLETLKNSAGLVTGGGRRVDELGDATELAYINEDAEYFAYIASLIVAALRSTMVAVDVLAYALVALLPTRRRCVEFLVQKLADALSDAIAAYE